MVNQPKLAERAILMRLSAGMPGKSRKDQATTAEVKAEKSLGRESGAWIKNKWPKWALEPIEKLVNEARQYHAAVTLPFDAGIGILPAPLVLEYGDKMREFKGRFDNLVQSHFKPKYPEMVEWARREHNGTFDQSDYPADVAVICEAFHFATEPLPVPDAGHFESAMRSLLGADADSVNIRVQDAMQEAQKELMKRLIAPVRAMAAKLAEQPKEGKAAPIFRDSLVGNLKEIADLAPKLNLTGDATIDAFAAEIGKLARFTPELLRDSPNTRATVQTQAADLVKRLEGYKL